MSTASKEYPLPERVGPYKITKYLGRGGFAGVGLGVHDESGDKVAIKYYDCRRCKSSKNSIKKEISILKMVNHPNVVKFVETIETEFDVAIVMEYIEGELLIDYMVSSTILEENAARLIFSKIVAAVEHCHSLDIIHKDIKLDNIMITKSGDVKLIDFGLSTIAKPQEYCSTYSGSFLYNAPELWRREKYFGRPSDVWSLGVVLYALVTGFMPWDGKSTSDQIQNILACKYILPRELSLEVAFLIEKMLEMNPRERFTIESIKQSHWILGTIDEKLHRHQTPDILNLETIITFNISRSDIVKEDIQAEESTRKEDVTNRSKSPLPNIMSKNTHIEEQLESCFISDKLCSEKTDNVQPEYHCVH